MSESAAIHCKSLNHLYCRPLDRTYPQRSPLHRGLVASATCSAGPASRIAGGRATRSLGRAAEVVRISGKDQVRICGTRTSDRVSRKPARGAKFGDVAIDAVIEDVLDPLAESLVDQAPPGMARRIALAEPTNVGRHFIDEFSAHAPRATRAKRET